MSQHSEDPLLSSSAPDEARTVARLLPFEQPQSELQKAVQLRAQQSIEMNRRRDQRQPPVARWLIGVAVALVPVWVLIVGLDGFLRIFHKINAAYAVMPAPEPPAASEPQQTEPGVVMLQPVEKVEGAQSPAATSAIPAPSR